MFEQERTAKKRPWLVYLLVVIILFIIITGIRNNNTAKTDTPPAETTSGESDDSGNGIGGWWCLVLPLIGVGLYAGFVVIYNVRNRRQWRDYFQADKSEAGARVVLEKYATKLAKGDDSPRTIITLATAQVNIGDLATAEHNARILLDRLVNSHLAGQTGQVDVINKAIWLLYTLMGRQGRFIEAAELLQNHPLPSIVRNSVSIALSYYLGGDEENARIALGILRITPDTPNPPRLLHYAPDGLYNAARYHGPQDRLLIAYLRHKLYDENPLPIYQKYAEHMALVGTWKITDNVFVQRLNEVEAEMRAVIRGATP